MLGEFKRYNPEKIIMKPFDVEQIISSVNELINNNYKVLVS